MIERRIRSFVRCEGRMTPAQQRALVEQWDRYGIDPGSGWLDLEAVFGRPASRILEIGFGDGEALLTQAQAQPETDFLGVEVHQPGIGHLLLRAAALEMGNLRVICADAVAVVERHLADAVLDHIQIYFPDPWPKARHHKRRLLQPRFAAQLARVLKPGGHLHLATDWEEYALHILAVLNAVPELVNTAADGFAPRPPWRPPTKFERRGQRLGHGVWDLLFERSCLLQESNHESR